MGERGFTRFELEISVGRISYIAWHPSFCDMFSYGLVPVNVNHILEDGLNASNNSGIAWVTTRLIMRYDDGANVAY